MTWATPRSTEFNPPNTKYHTMTNETFAWFGGVASPCHINVMGHEAMSLLQQAADATHVHASTWECRSTQVVMIVEGQTKG